jgi:putative SOS response-associated peptidase YedK
VTDGGFFRSLPHYRRLIPMTAFAQPEGPSGRMTRSWFSVRDWPIFAWAGFCWT